MVTFLMFVFMKISRTIQLNLFGTLKHLKVLKKIRKIFNISAKTNTSIHHKLYDYIRFVDDKKLYAIYNLLEGEIEKTKELWKNMGFVEELDKRYEALEAGADKGFTIEQLQKSIDKLRT